jgi:hypothetical protein
MYCREHDRTVVNSTGGSVNKNNDHADVGARIHVSRTVVFSLWKSGELASVTIGRRRFSTDRQIDQYLSRLEMAASDGGDAA